MPQIIQPLPHLPPYDGYLTPTGGPHGSGIQINKTGTSFADASRLTLYHRDNTHIHNVEIYDKDNSTLIASFSIGPLQRLFIEKKPTDIVKLPASSTNPFHNIFVTKIGFRDEGYQGEIIKEVGDTRIVGSHNYPTHGDPPTDYNTFIGYSLVHLRNTTTNTNTVCYLYEPAQSEQISRFVIGGLEEIYVMKKPYEHFKVAGNLPIEGTPVAF